MAIRTTESVRKSVLPSRSMTKRAATGGLLKRTCKAHSNWSSANVSVKKVRNNGDLRVPVPVETQRQAAKNSARRMV